MWNYQPRKTCGKNAKYRQKELTRYDKFATIISKQAVILPFIGENITKFKCTAA